MSQPVFLALLGPAEGLAAGPFVVPHPPGMWLVRHAGDQGLRLPQILAAALTECHRKSSAQGKPLALKVFVAGRNQVWRMTEPLPWQKLSG